LGIHCLADMWYTSCLRYRSTGLSCRLLALQKLKSIHIQQDRVDKWLGSRLSRCQRDSLVVRSLHQDMLFRLGMEYSRTTLSMFQEGIVVCPLLENIGNLSGMVHMQMNPLLRRS